VTFFTGGKRQVLLLAHGEIQIFANRELGMDKKTGKIRKRATASSYFDRPIFLVGSKKFRYLCSLFASVRIDKQRKWYQMS